MSENKELTGYPSIDKPWLKYYSREAIEAKLPEKTLWQYVYENNKDYPNDIAFRYFGTKITYGEFFENVKKAARSFVAMGIGEDDIVTIMSMHTPETIYSIYALNYIGAVANLVYMTLSPKEILYTVENTESKLLMVLDPALEKVAEVQKGLSVPIVVLSVSDSMPFHLKAGYRLKNKARLEGAEAYKMFLKHGENEPLPTEATSSETVAVIVYTSGTTGDPKGVMLSSDNLNGIPQQYKLAKMGLDRRDSFLDILPMFIGFGVSMLHLVVVLGLDTTLWIEFDEKRVAKAFNKVKPNHFVASPLFLNEIINAFQGEMDFLKNFAVGGEAVSEETEDKTQRFLQKRHANARFVSSFGMTETAAVVCRGTNYAQKDGSVGIPLANVNLKVVDVESRCEKTYGEEGELIFSSPSIMIGYYDNLEATNDIIETDVSGTRWIHTGDIGYVDEDGFVFVKGRIKRMYVTAVYKEGGKPFIKSFQHI